MQNEQDDIETILDEFDFEKAHQAMTALNWKWATSAGVPTIGELRKHARMLLNCAKNANSEEPDYLTASGGFYVSRNLYPGNAKRYYSLSFIVSEWNNYE
jgi:hypothetical protein